MRPSLPRSFSPSGLGPFGERRNGNGAGSSSTSRSAPSAGQLSRSSTARSYSGVSSAPAARNSDCSVGYHYQDGSRSALAVILLDYTLWIWHWLNHRVPLLWRFHAAHHADLDVDASTAFRFHIGELLLSVPFRALQVAFIGVEVPVLLFWEALLLVATEFHHSNLRPQLSFERWLRLGIVTPRMHGIHHSIAPTEVNSNFGTPLARGSRQ